PGDVLAVRITAEDFKPQLATSTVRRLTIITDDELESRLASRQSAILSQLAEALSTERQCAQQTGELAARLSALERVATSDLTPIEAARHGQQQVERLLGSAPDGAHGQI